MVRLRESVGEVKQGAKFGKRTVLGHCFGSGGRYWMVVVRCDCGKVDVVEARGLQRGRRLCCGSCQSRKHGMSAHKLYGVYEAMIQRCYNQNCEAYPNYGARGIAVCAEWIASIESFLSWAIGNGYRPGLQIDRQDTNGNYSPDNCRFVAARVNMQNRRSNVFLEAFGERKVIAEWLRDPRCVVKEWTLRNRIQDKGWDAERALTTQPDLRKLNKKYVQEFKR